MADDRPPPAKMFKGNSSDASVSPTHDEEDMDLSNKISAGPNAEGHSVRECLQGVVGNAYFSFPKQDLVLLMMKTLAEMGCR